MKAEGKRVEKAQGQERAVSALRMLWHTCLPFFVLSFVYLWLVVQPNLIYYCLGTVLPDASPFATGWTFLHESLRLPGGPAAYISGFLSQGYYYGWLGALIIVLAGFGLTELSRRHLVKAGLIRAAALAGLPAVIFFLIYSRYRHPLTICLVVSLGLLLSLIFERLPRRRPLVRGAACSLLALLGFWLGGGGTLLVFALMTVIYPIFAYRSEQPLDVTQPGRVCTAHQQRSDGVQDGVPCTPYYSDHPQIVGSPCEVRASVPCLRWRRHALINEVKTWLRERSHGTQQRLPTGLAWSQYYRVPTPVDGAHIRRDGAVVALGLLASMVLAWAAARYVFLLPTGEALLTFTPFAPTLLVGMDTLLKVLMFLLYGSVPLLMLLAFAAAGVLARCRRRQGTPIKPTRVKGKHKGADHPRQPAVLRPLSSVLRLLFPVLGSPSVMAAVLLALGLYFTHDVLRKPYVLSNYYSRQRQWDKILALGRRLPGNRNNVYVNHDIDRALYHTGRLPFDMFRYPQDPQALLLTHERSESDLTQWKLSDIFLELGHVNMAEKLASELVTRQGHLAPALEELGWISIIKGSPDTARVYLNALAQDLIYRGRATSLLHALDRGFTPAQTNYIEGIRSCLRDESAGVTGAEPLDETLAALLERNPRNRMAFEYLMACYLLAGRVDKIAENADRLRDLGYPQIPTLYQEAILIHFGTQGREIDLTRFAISQDTLRRYEAFVRLNSTLNPQNQPAVLNRLIRDFGTTYFFYYSFGRVGLTSGN